MSIQITLTDEQVKVLSKDLVKAGINLGNITDRVKTFEDVLALYSGDMANKRFLLNYNGNDKDILASKALLKLSIIREVLNEGWTPDWNNDLEYKYYPYFDMRNNTLVYGNYHDWYTFSLVSSRLCFKTSALAEYAGKQFIEIYKDLFII